MRFGVDALRPTFAGEKRKTGLPAKERKLQVQQKRGERQEKIL
jgi:hypothetical protein